MPLVKSPLLGEFIRAHRERLTTSQVGLPDGLRRRAKGLRREEVASLCGISPTWLTWIEQGRALAVSPGTLARIATVLKLKQAEREYLFDLAALRDPDAPEPEINSELKETLTRAVNRIQSPAYVLDQKWDVLVWNRPAEELFVGWLTREPAGTQPNLLHYMFKNPGARKLVTDWETRAQRLVAEFRADVGDKLEEDAIYSFVSDLRVQSEDFEMFWRRQDVMEREGGDRIFNHPRFGSLIYQQLTLRVANSPDLKLVMLL
jgi:transcriptional regulator with XRE-family HTH domain